jgi:hypothetical protein
VLARRPTEFERRTLVLERERIDGILRHADAGSEFSRPRAVILAPGRPQVEMRLAPALVLLRRRLRLLIGPSGRAHPEPLQRRWP